MRALIDLDIVTYEIASATDEEGSPLVWPLIKSRVDTRIEGLLWFVNAESWQGYLTGKGNFRDKVATILPYKGPRRLKEKPFYYEKIRDYLVSSRHAVMVEGMEADDAIAMAHHDSDGSTTICSRDKDFNQLEGRICKWDNDGYLSVVITPVEATRFFYKQLLTGDSSDNILGLYNVGAKSALLKQIDEMDSEADMLRHVVSQYYSRFGAYWYDYLLENGTLLWLLRFEGDKYEDRLQRGLSSLGGVPNIQRWVLHSRA